ncbi:hypothetical protein DIPPA_70053 [Diplonema papillatum]|nr:hypothetical protein DIPPA_70053 [Diplonema papillatum]
MTGAAPSLEARVQAAVKKHIPPAAMAKVWWEEQFLPLHNGSKVTDVKTTLQYPCRMAYHRDALSRLFCVVTESGITIVWTRWEAFCQQFEDFVRQYQPTLYLHRQLETDTIRRLTSKTVLSGAATPLSVPYQHSKQVYKLQPDMLPTTSLPRLLLLILAADTAILFRHVDREQRAKKRRLKETEVIIEEHRGVCNPAPAYDDSLLPIKQEPGLTQMKAETPDVKRRRLKN